MSHKNHNTCKMHDKSRGMINERSRDRFIHEKKDLEHELTHHKTEIQKLLNEHYTYHSTQRRRNGYVVKFQDPTDHHMEKLTFQFETNLKTLEKMWETTQ